MYMDWRTRDEQRKRSAARLFIFALLLGTMCFLLGSMRATPAHAQWQVPNHSVPIGRGSGSGFKNAAPGTAGCVLASAGASADPTFSCGITPTMTGVWTFAAQQTITFDAGGAELLKIVGTGTNTASGYIGMDGTAGKQTGFNLRDGGVIKWQFIKQTDNTFLIFDAVNSVVMATYNPGAAGVGFINYANTKDASSSTTGSLVSAGGIGVAKALWVGTYVATTPVAVGSLPSCAAGTKGARMFVTDSNAASFTAGIGAVVAAGGTTNVPVTCDGTNWRIG